MKKDQPHDSGLEFEHKKDAFNLGPAYLDYCVRKGWLKKTGEPPKAIYCIGRN